VYLLSRGSVKVDSVLEFDTTNGSAPNATQVKDILVAAIKNENLTLQINESSISATEITDTNGQCIYKLIVFLLQ